MATTARLGISRRLLRVVLVATLLAWHRVVHTAAQAYADDGGELQARSLREASTALPSADLFVTLAGTSRNVSDEGLLLAVKTDLGVSSSAASSSAPLLTPLLVEPLYYNFNYNLDRRFLLWYGIARKWCLKYCKYLCRHAGSTTSTSVADPVYYTGGYFDFICNNRCNDACTDYYQDVYVVEWNNADRDRWFAKFSDGSFPGGILP